MLLQKKIMEWEVAAPLVTFLVATYSLPISSSFQIFQITYAENIQGSISHQQRPLIGVNSTIILKSNSHQYPINYHTTSGRISGIFIEKDNTTLLLNLSSVSNGTLIIELPRNVIDSKGPGNVDENFTVFEDGQYVGYNQIRTNSQSRTIMLNFDNKPSVIEITGTRTVPEFANITIVILAASVTGLLVIGRKSKLTSKISTDRQFSKFTGE